MGEIITTSGIQYQFALSLIINLTRLEQNDRNDFLIGGLSGEISKSTSRGPNLVVNNRTLVHHAAADGTKSSMNASRRGTN